MNSKVETYVRTLDKELSRFSVLRELETRTGVPKVHLSLGALAGLVFFVIVGFNASFFSDLTAFLYPAFATLCFLDSSTNSGKDATQWLAYWILFGAVKFLDNLKFLINHIPVYNLLKTVFLVWCFLPQFQGASVLYRGLLRKVPVSRIAKSFDTAPKVPTGGPKKTSPMSNGIDESRN